VASFAFRQVDVFTGVALKGNPLAVVIGADALTSEQMSAFANWTNLSETTYLLKPTTAGADYRVRIFTPARELPFAGHPTLGSCHVWLGAGGKPRGQEVVQECGAGLVRIRRDGQRLAFAAPPLKRSGAVEPEVLAQIARSLEVAPSAIRASQWIDNGPGWVAVLLGSRTEVLALKPDFVAMRGLALGVVAPWEAKDGTDAQFEVRAFIPGDGVTEDPVTGSLNAGLGQWLIGAGLAPQRYVAGQGTAIGRDGRVIVEKIGDDVWVGGETVTCVEGTVTL
jgi:PhzF family phenazine biosynthesis protein